MKKGKILFVTIKNKYIEFLSKYEHKIAQKNKRIWIGVIFQVKHYMYFAPLSSPKTKRCVNFKKLEEVIENTSYDYTIKETNIANPIIKNR